MRALVLVLLLGPLALLWNALVLSILWGWFIVPLGVPAIGVAHAVGLFMLVKTVYSRRAARDEEINEAFVVKQVVSSLIGGTFCLLTGWFAQGWSQLLLPA